MQFPGFSNLAHPVGIPTGGIDVVARTIQAVFTLGLIAAFVLALAFLVLGAMKWITSGGDKAGTLAARHQITYALVGLIVVILAWALLSLVQDFFFVRLGVPLNATPPGPNGGPVF